jgi:tetratricopeptide (TPR) repeat protein
MAQRSIGRWDEALRIMNKALDCYGALGRAEDIGRLGWAMVYQLVWTARLVEAVQVGQRALAELAESVSADKARLLSALGFAISLSGDYAAATAAFDQARALAEQVGNERALADVLHMETFHHFGYCELDQAVDVGLRAAEIFEQDGALWDLCSVHGFVVYEDGTLPRRQLPTSLGDKTLDSAERLGHLGAAFLVLSDRIRRAAILGDLARVEALGPQIVDITERGGLPWHYIGHVYQGLAAHWRGNADHAEVELRRAVELEPPTSYAGQSIALLAWHLAQQGRTEEVMELFDSAQSQSRLPSPDRVNSIGSWNCMLGFAEAFYLCGLPDQAAALSTQVERLLGLGRRWTALDGRLVETRAGVVAASARRWNEAERHFATAREIAEQMPSWLELADLGRLEARMLLERADGGDHARAAGLLEPALAAYRAFGMPAYAADAEALLHQARGWSASLITPG